MIGLFSNTRVLRGKFNDLSQKPANIPPVLQEVDISSLLDTSTLPVSGIYPSYYIIRKLAREVARSS